MEKKLLAIMGYIKRHKTATILIVGGLFLAPIVVVHILFKVQPENKWFSAEWGAGDILTYIAGFEAFLGTVALGLVAVYQSEKARQENERLSKENNFLQKISVQKMLPLVRVTAIEVKKSSSERQTYFKNDMLTACVTETVTREKREIALGVYLPLPENKQYSSYKKVVKLVLNNISDSPISQISVDQVELSGFYYQDYKVESVSCKGKENGKFISWLLMPGDSIEISINIFFDNILYKKFWEFEDSTSIGNFDICLYITNASLSGILCKEKIYIQKGMGFKEHVMYKAYPDGIDDC